MVLKLRTAYWWVVMCAWQTRLDHRWQPLACVLSCFAGVACAEVIRLGGPRDIVVNVEDVRGGFSVTVEMQPVSCFDAATNARINRSKAGLYGLAGLAKSLDVDAARLSVERNVSGVTVDGVQQGALRYRLVLFVPEASLNVFEDGDSEPVLVGGPGTSESSSQAASQLFTCVHDHEMTIEEVRKSFAEQVSQLMGGAATTASSPSVKKQAEVVRVALNVLDADARKAFSAAQQDIEGDLRLLSVEKEGLSKTLARAQDDFKKIKAEAVEEAENLSLIVETPASDEGPTNTDDKQVPK